MDTATRQQYRVPYCGDDWMKKRGRALRLDLTTRKLQAFLGGAAATTNPTVSVSYTDYPNRTKDDFSRYLGAMQFTVLSGVTETDVCAAPLAVGMVREIDYISIYNADTAGVVVTICIDDNGTNRIQSVIALATTETLVWTPESGWNIVT